MAKQRSSAEFVRANPQPFIGPGVQPDLRSLAAGLAEDALMLGISSVTIEQFQEWFVVAAEHDWLTRNTDLSLVECFHRIQRFPEHRENSNRTPVVVTAFAANVLVLGSEGPTVIQGCTGDLTALRVHLQTRFPGWRVVAFSTLVPLSEERLRSSE
jgi:hypothetical protein